MGHHSVRVGTRTKASAALCRHYLKLNDDAIYIPLDQEEMPSMRFEVIKPWLQAWCSRPEHTWVGFDLKSMYRFYDSRKH